MKKGIQLTEDDSKFVDQMVDKVPVTARHQIRREMEELFKLEALAKRFAGECFPPDLWHHCSDEELTAWMGLPSEQPAALRELTDHFLEEFEGQFESTDERDEFRVFVTLALRASLTQEYGRRFEKQEQAPGRALRHFLNERSDETRKKLIKQTTRSWWEHPELLGTEGRKELGSMAIEALWKRISQLPNFKARLGERLGAMLAGDYNRIPENARASVVGQLQTLAGRSMISLDDLPESLEGDAPEEHRILTEYAAHRSEEERKHQVLIDHILEHEDISEKDKELLSLHFREGFIQEEIARIQGRTQSAVSQQLSRLLAQLRDRIAAALEEQE